MKRKATLGIALAIATAAPSVVAPRVVLAQDAANPAPAEYPDVPRGHWAYDAINRLSQIGVIEGKPNGNYEGNKAMTRYEFAVAIARLLDRIPTGGGGGGDPVNLQPILDRLTTLEGRPVPDIFRAEVNDLIGTLRREFADELARLGVRVDALEGRVTALENRVQKPGSLSVGVGLLHRTGTANYISQVPVAGQAGVFAPAGAGRSIVNGNSFGATQLPRPPYTAFTDRDERVANEKYSYTDLEISLKKEVTDRLQVVANLRGLGSTQEDPWAGDSGSSAYVREAYAVADLSDRSFIGIKGLKATLGRQPTKIAQGLLYDNDLQPTDQVKGEFNLGPLALTAFIGTNNNQLVTSGGSGNPYIDTGAVRYLGLNGDNGLFGQGNNTTSRSGAFVGFGRGTSYQDDNEAAVRAGFNLFRIGGQPVSVGITRLFDGVSNQKGDSIDLSLPLFNRTIGVEYVRQRSYMGERSSDKGNAYNITVPLFRARLLDLNFAYGKAEDSFEFFAASSANPFARTYAEALFDRPMALGAPMINGRFFNNGGSPLNGAVPAYAAAKEAFDFTGTLRVLRRLPLDFRYYRAYGSRLAGGGRENALDLGTVYTVGSNFNISPGLDLEVKYGRYLVPGAYPSLEYVRVGANVGF